MANGKAELFRSANGEVTNLRPSLDAYGKEIFVEKQDERGRPVIWYKLDRRGHRTQYRRTPNGIMVNARDESSA